MGSLHQLVKICFVFSAIFLVNGFSYSACGGTVRTWKGTTVNWLTTTNWTGSNVPDTASEDVVIVNTGFNARLRNNYSLGCLEVQSGAFQGDQANTVSIKGDYFKAPYQNTLSITNNGFVIEMSGTSSQIFEAVDDIRDLSITNPTDVTLRGSFRIVSDILISGNGTTYIENDVRLESTTITQVIPAGHTVVIKAGASLYAGGGLTVNGVLRIEPGGRLIVRSTEALTIASGGVLNLNGASGNPAKIESGATDTYYTFDMQGTMYAQYFQIYRTTGSGLNVTGNVSTLSDGDFRGINSNSSFITLGATANVPTTLSRIGFYNDDARTTLKNINATAYTGPVISVDQYSGGIIGSTYETDPGNKITWLTAATTTLVLVNDAENNEPTVTTAANVTQVFAEFAFSLSKTDVATDITQATITMLGTANVSDLLTATAFADSNNNCNYNAGVDTSLGSLAFSGSPPKATITIPAAALRTTSATVQACLHIVATTAANPTDQSTLRFAIVSPSDVVNSQSRLFSENSGPPVEGRTTTLVNTNFARWDGQTSSVWNLATNWNNIIPSATVSCDIGVGTNNTAVDATPVACYSAYVQTNATLNWASTTNVFEVYNSLEVYSGVTFLNATSATFLMKGSSNQTVSLATLFPGHLSISNTGASGSNIVSIVENSSIGGNLNCNSGVVSISSGKTLTVGGQVNVNSGCQLIVEAGATLVMSNGKTLTVSSGGSLQLVGSSGSSAKVTSVGVSSSYNVVVNGTISANYYSFERLGTNGVSIESGATISSTNYLQNGSYLYPVSSNTTLLKLKRQIPGNSLGGMSFDSGGSSSSSIVNIDTTGASAGTLSITSYSGDLSGPTYDNDPSYAVSWSGATNTLEITNQQSGPTSVTAGNSYVMGRFGLKQSQAGASYTNTDINKIILTLNGTGAASDVSSVMLFADPDCDSANGSLIGTGTFSGSPAKATFNLSAGQLTVQAHTTTPPTTCFYVQYSIASGATGGSTVGVNIASSTDITNTNTYGFKTGYSPPLTLGASATIISLSSTIWTGTIDTDWFNASNWSAGLPSSTKSCDIPNVANDPIIGTGTATCLNVNITTGILGLSSGATLSLYGNFTNAGTLNQSGTLSLVDGGASTSRTISSSSTLSNLTINTTGAGTISVGGSTLTASTITIGGSSSFVLDVPNGKKLILLNGLNLSRGTLNLNGGSTLELASGKSVVVTGGNFVINGTVDAFPQSSSNKALIQPQGGSGTWGFSSSSGTINVKGFYFNKMDNNGFQIGGTTSVTQFKGGQFTNLSSAYSSMKALQLNTTGALPVTMDKVAWTWGGFNSFSPLNASTPTTTDAYTLVYSSGCGGQSVDFTGWTGDWYESRPTFNVGTKVTKTNCNISLGASASAVKLLSFSANGYNAAVELKWRTNYESNHLGFNVYRADESGVNFQQINGQIIKNQYSSSSNKGDYRFVDNDVNNGVKYYYYIEDIEIDGTKTLHGPVDATPGLTMGAVPAAAVGESSYTNANDSVDENMNVSTATIPNPSYMDLGNGVVIHSQTSQNIKIEITPSSPIFTVATWNNTYDDVSIVGYSQTLIPGEASLPERVILIEVPNYTTSASVLTSSVVELGLASHKISPSPTYVLTATGFLNKSFTPNTAFYTKTTDEPESYFYLDPLLVSIGEEKYLKLKINPLKYNPSVNGLKLSSSIMIDIGLDGKTWEMSDPPANLSTAELLPNALQVDIDSEGIFQISYEDLYNAQIEGPFKNQNVANFRLYADGSEVPIEINSTSGLFSPGDSIRFYSKFTSTQEDKKKRLILSTKEVGTTGQAPKRMSQTDVSVNNGVLATENIMLHKKELEENNLFVDGYTLDDNLEHFFWKHLYNYTGQNILTTNVSLLAIDTQSSINVNVVVSLKGMLSFTESEITHHLKLSVNGQDVADKIFASNLRQDVLFEVPADAFTQGSNIISLTNLGTYASSGEYDRVYIDKIKFEYAGYKQSGTNNERIILNETNVVHTLRGFSTSDLSLYNTTDKDNPKKLINATVVSLDGNVTYESRFFIEEQGNSEEEVYIVGNGSFLRPVGLSLSPGYQAILRNQENKANLLIIGHKNLLKMTDNYVRWRESQNLYVKKIDINQIYAEFNFGSKSSESIRKFVEYARKYWSVPPKYILFLGDATLDPKDINVDGLSPSDSSTNEIETTLIPLMNGRFIDFFSDHGFVLDGHSNVPQASIGRIPSNNEDEIRDYLEKIIDYESGKIFPEKNLQLTQTLIIDQNANYYDQFSEKASEFVNSSKMLRSQLLDRKNMASNAQMKSEIDNMFSNSPLLMTFIGHGAFDRWGDNIFNVTDFSNLTNLRLPIVTVLNCEAAYFYNPDKSFVSIGEKMITNKNGGAIAVIGLTSMTTPAAQSLYYKKFIETIESSLAKPYTGSRLGDYFVQSKLSMGSGPYEVDVIKSMVILGDPSLKLPESMFLQTQQSQGEEVERSKAVSSGKKKNNLLSGLSCGANASTGDKESIYYVFELILWIISMKFIHRVVVSRRNNGR